MKKVMIYYQNMVNINEINERNRNNGNENNIVKEASERKANGINNV